MKFLIDAQLPNRLKNWIASQGFDVIHTDDLPQRNKTSDSDIIKLAESEDRIVISKDGDFFKYNLISGTPRRVLMITTGNIINKELTKLFEVNFSTIKALFEKGDEIIEINNTSIFVHK